MKNGKRGFVLPRSRKLASKRHVGKIMVWTAIGRPLYDSKTGECIFDGKVHMETITHWHKLKRGKRKGRKVIRNVKVDGKKAREMIRNTYAAIVEKFPTAYRRRKIWLQMDNARPHVAEATRRECKRLHTEYLKHGWDIEVVFQPPRSPDMNVNDLIVYKSMSSIVKKKRMKTLAQLKKRVGFAWGKLDDKVISRAWCILFQNMKYVLETNGDNDYTYPHTSLRKRHADALKNPPRGRTPFVPTLAVPISQDVIKTADAYMKRYTQWLDDYAVGQDVNFEGEGLAEGDVDEVESSSEDEEEEEEEEDSSSSSEEEEEDEEDEDEDEDKELVVLSEEDEDEDDDDMDEGKVHMEEEQDAANGLLALAGGDGEKDKEEEPSAEQ